MAYEYTGGDSKTYTCDAVAQGGGHLETEPARVVVTWPRVASAGLLEDMRKLLAGHGLETMTFDYDFTREKGRAEYILRQKQEKV